MVLGTLLTPETSYTQIEFGSVVKFNGADFRFRKIKARRKFRIDPWGCAKVGIF